MWNRDSSVKTGEGELRSVQPAPGPVRVPEERRMVAWVGKSVIFKGTLISSEDMTIDGRVEGSIEVRDQGLVIGPDADINADIVAKTVTIHGVVHGAIRASEKVDIRESGSVEGDIVAPRIAIAEGAVVRGRIDTLTGRVESSKHQPQLAAV